MAPTRLRYVRGYNALLIVTRVVIVCVYQACKLAIRESIEAEICKEANPDAAMDVINFLMKII